MKSRKVLNDLVEQGVWYLACAHASGGALTDLVDPELRRAIIYDRYTRTERVGGLLYNLGFVLIEPIASSYNKVEMCNIPNEFSYWIQRDLKLIDVSHGILVFEDPADPDAWKTSGGVTCEIEHAKSNGQPIYKLEFDEDLTEVRNIVQLSALGYKDTREFVEATPSLYARVLGVFK